MRQGAGSAEEWRGLYKAANPEEGKDTEDGLVNPTAFRYLEDLVNGNDAYEDPVRNELWIIIAQALEVLPAGLLLGIN